MWIQQYGHFGGCTRIELSYREFFRILSLPSLKQVGCMHVIVGGHRPYMSWTDLFKYLQCLHNVKFAILYDASWFKINWVYFLIRSI